MNPISFASCKVIVIAIEDNTHTYTSFSCIFTTFSGPPRAENSLKRALRTSRSM